MIAKTLFNQFCSRMLIADCRIKYYNNVLFHNVQQNFIAQSGDPTGTGTGGDSIYGYTAALFYSVATCPPSSRQCAVGSLCLVTGRLG